MAWISILWPGMDAGRNCLQNTNTVSDKAKKNYRDPNVSRRIYLPGSVRLRNARAVLIEAAHRRMSLDEIANTFGVSRQHLFRLFHDKGTPSPMRQVRCLQLEEALHRICDQGESVESLAREFNYSSGSSLRRALRRAFGYNREGLQGHLGTN